MQRPISQSNNNVQTTNYAYEGRTTSIEDPNGHVRYLVHDVNGWLRDTRDPLGYSTLLGYDAAGSKTSVTDSLGNSLWTGTYAYGVSPFLVGESDVDRGTWGYTVDALGERTAWTDPKGQHFYETYDALSRPLTRTEPDLFSQWTWGSSAASHNIGQLQSVCSGSGTSCSASSNSQSNTYDSLGRLYQRVTAYPAWGSFTMTWQYNSTTGFLDTLTYPRSTAGKYFEVKYAYQNGLLQSITDVMDSPNVTIWQADTQNPAGQITEETLGNGLVTTRAYDAVTGWLGSVQSGPSGGASIQNQSFLYDEVGNVTQRQDNNLGLTENFYYDNDDRLSYSTLNGVQNLSLSYDPMGNITSRSDVAAGATWTYDPVHLHQVTQAGSSAYKYVYDANGNIKTRQGVSITWSSYNYPTYFNSDANGESIGLGYDANRQAYFEQTNGPQGLEQIYDIDRLFDVVGTSTATDYRHYVYAGSEPVAIVSRKSTGVNATYYLLSDHQGSVAAITNSAGGVVVGESFAAYGARRNPGTWSGAPSGTDLTTIAGITRHGYTFQGALGQQTGLIYMVGRVQDAITGRFLSADPRIPDPTDPQSYNPYSYVMNNPLSYVDPTGFSGCGPGNFAATVCSGPYGAPSDPFDDLEQGDAIQTTNGANPTLELLTPASVRGSFWFGNKTLPSSAPPATAPQQSNPTSPTTLPTVAVTATTVPSALGDINYSLGVQDYVYSGLGGYSALSENLLEAVGYKSTQMLGKLDLSLPSNISDLPNGVAGVATFFEAYGQYENGDFYGAAQTSGSGLGGIFGGNYGADVGGALGSSFGPVGTGVGAVVGGVIGGLGGSYVGGTTAGYLYNNIGAVGNAINTWGQYFTPYSF